MELEAKIPWIVKRRHDPGGLLSFSECVELMNWAGACGRLVTALEVGHFRGLSTLMLLRGLPEGSTLVTVDHHRGDVHVARGHSSPSAFMSTIGKHGDLLDRVKLAAAFIPYQQLLTMHPGPYDFVFYDGQHTPEDCEEFWRRVQLSPNCILCYDDADWECMQRLGELAEADNFKDVTRLVLQRLEDDKNADETYTLRVLRREVDHG